MSLETNQLNSRVSVNYSQADCVVALGTRLGPFGTNPQYGMDYWPRDASVIQVELNARRVGRVKPLREGHDVGICGDAGLAAQDLLGRLREGSWWIVKLFTECSQDGEKLSSSRAESAQAIKSAAAYSVSRIGHSGRGPCCG